jgi:hypothetical protein
VHAYTVVWYKFKNHPYTWINRSPHISINILCVLRTCENGRRHITCNLTMRSRSNYVPKCVPKMFQKCSRSRISTIGKFSTERKFCRMWLADTNFPWETKFDVENFQLLTMIFSENFLSVEIFLKCKWDLTSAWTSYVLWNLNAMFFSCPFVIEEGRQRIG